MTVMTYGDIVRKAKQIKQNVESNYELGDSPKWSYYFAMTVLNPRKNIPVKKFQIQKKNTGNNFSRQIKKADYVDMAKRFTKYVEYNKRLPNNIKCRDKLMRVTDYTYMFAWIVVFYDVKGKLPSIAPVNSKLFIKPTEPTNTVYEYFVKVFGKIDCIDDALEKIAGNGYGYYYDDQYSNKEAINRMHDGDGVNCTDSCHVFYNLGLEFIKQGKYTKVECLHILCRGGDGHVRLRFTLPDGEMFYRDPAAVLDTGDIEYNWCSDGELLAVNPEWFMQNLNK